MKGMAPERSDFRTRSRAATAVTGGIAALQLNCKYPIIQPDIAFLRRREETGLAARRERGATSNMSATSFRRADPSCAIKRNEI
jgi:hypothetical protein